MQKQKSESLRMCVNEEFKVDHWWGTRCFYLRVCQYVCLHACMYVCMLIHVLIYPHADSNERTQHSRIWINYSGHHEDIRQSFQ